MPKPPKPKTLDALTHDKARRINNPTAELQDLAEQQEEGRPLGAAHFSRARPLAAGEVRERDADLDPQIVWNGARITLTREQAKQLAETGTVEIGDAQLVWRGKDRQDWSDLVVNQPMIYVQEKVHPKAIIDDLKRRTTSAREADTDAPDLFGDFNGLPSAEARAEFYQHGLHWANRMILGDSLQVMASLAGREGLKGKVQCIYFDPPYGIKFNSNWQVSTQSRDVKDGKREDVSREPEQVKAFRDTWKDGIHSYLTYLRDRLTVARELLTESGSIFVQIGDENVHRVRALMDEVFGAENFVSQISVQKTSGQTARYLAGVVDYVLWFAKDPERLKFRKLQYLKPTIRDPSERYVCVENATGAVIDLSVRHKRGDLPLPLGRVLRLQDTSSQTGSVNSRFSIEVFGENFKPTGKRGWSFSLDKASVLTKSGRLFAVGSSLRWKNYHDESSFSEYENNWTDISPSGFGEDRVYVVQTISDPTFPR
jgi:adenine-specific DNA-methyltransferase